MTELVLALAIGILAASGIWLLLRPRTFQVIIGLCLLSYGVNLVYQFWIHAEWIPRLGWMEGIFNTPSAHRVHHGTNSEYLDRNHGSILIVWDKLFGTFEPEDARVIYGLTKNIDTFNPVRIASHEWVEMFKDVASADTWGDRWSYLLRGPGWAYDRRNARLVAV